MKKLITLALLMLTQLYSIGQLSQFDWAVSNEGVGNDDQGSALATDSQGNVIVVGYYKDSADFDPGVGVYFLKSLALKDIFVQKLDSNGNLLWAVSVGGTQNDLANSVAVDGNDNIILVGSFGSTVDFDPDTSQFLLTASPSANHAFALKLSPTGKFVWAVGFGANSLIHAADLSIDDTSNIYICGKFANTVDFDPDTGTFNLTYAGQADIFVQKLDSNGKFQWAVRVGNNSHEFCNAITLDPFGDLLITGTADGTVDFDPGPNVHNVTTTSADVYVLKLSQMGDFVWARTVGGTALDEGKDLVADDQGSVYCIGDYYQSGDFDPSNSIYTLTSNGSIDAFVLKLDSAGTFVWAKTIGGSIIDRGEGITLDINDQPIVYGTFEGQADLDPSGASHLVDANGQRHSFSVSLNVLGHFNWGVSTRGPSGSVLATRLTTSSSNDVYLTGKLDKKVDFDPGPDSTFLNGVGFMGQPGADIFVWKLSQCIPPSRVDSVEVCDSLQWIDGNTYYTSNYFAKHLIPNVGSCDSLIELKLTVLSNTGLDILSACDSLTWIDGVTYLSNNSSAQYTITNSHGCDSVVSLDLTIYESASSVDYIRSCDSLTWIDGMTYYANTDTVTFALNTINGCDSTIHLDLEIINVEADITQSGSLLASVNDSATSYQWLLCDSNYLPISGANSSTYNVTENGNYALRIVGDNGCVDTSDCVSVTGIGLGEERSKTLFSFTREERDHYAIENRTGIVSEFVLYDTNGRTIRIEERVNPGRSTIRVQIPQGIYIAILRNEISSERFVIPVFNTR